MPVRLTVADEPLRYKFKPQQAVPYRVKVEVETPAAFETMTGIISLTGKEVANDTLTVVYNGGLSKAIKGKSTGGGRGGFGPGGPGRFGPGGPSFPRSPFDQPTYRGLSNTNNEIVITDRGSVRGMRGDTQLPYLLGNLSMFPLDPLPEGLEDQWQEGNSLTITSKSDTDSRFGPGFGPFGNQNNEQVKTGGGERHSYKIESKNGDLVTIAKTYSLDSPSTGKEDPAFKVEGKGTWIFNQTEGVSESMDFSSQMVVSENNSDVRIPIKIEWKRIPTEEYEKIVKEQQEKHALFLKQVKEKQELAAKEAKEKEGKELPAEEKTKIMTELNSKDWPTISRRLDSLKGFVPHPNDFDVAKRVKELRSHKVLSVSRTAKELWDRLEPILEAEQEKNNSQSNEVVSGSDNASENPFATEEEKANSAIRGLRKWSDKTGAYKEDAIFLRVEGANAVLQRKDKKEVKVPISRLSPEDQKVIEELKKQ